MSPTPAPFSTRQATTHDRDLIRRFIQSPVYTQRHLDWRDPLDWLSHHPQERRPFWILEKNGLIAAVLACITEPDEVAWVRLFSTDSQLSPSWAWNILFERVYAELAGSASHPIIAALGLQDWFSDMLATNGFIRHQDIVVLSYDGPPPPRLDPDPALWLRPMRPEDIPAVTRLDNLAFESIWRLSHDDMIRAAERSNYKTVIELEGEIVAYQMSSVNGFTAHLARLAVNPRCQRRRIGYRVLQDVLRHYIDELSVWGVTLNTQDNNHASLALYRHTGFHLTGERFTVYTYPYRSV